MIILSAIGELNMENNTNQQFYDIASTFISILKQMSINKDPVNPNTLKEYLMKDMHFRNICYESLHNNPVDEIKKTVMKQVLAFKKYLNSENYLDITKTITKLDEKNMAESIASIISVIAQSYGHNHESFTKIDHFFKEIVTKISTSNDKMFSMMNENIKIIESDTEKDKQVLQDVTGINSSIENESKIEDVKSKINDFTNSITTLIEEKMVIKQTNSEHMKGELTHLQQELEVSKDKISSMQTELARYKEEAITDELTGLFRKNYMYRKFSEMIEYYRRHGVSFPVIMTDLDKFKRINDVYGHPQGDQVLKHFANILKKHLRTTDTAIRYGGEEFIIIMEQGSNINAACLLASRIHREMNDTIFRLKGDKVKITASFGIAEYQANESMDDTIESADQNLYKAKENGRNQIFYNKKKFEY